MLGNDQAISLESGCDDFLQKPINIDRLLACLQKYLQFEWVYEALVPQTKVEVTATEVEQTIPPAEELEKLVRATQIGDIMAIEEEAQRFINLDESYRGFAERILQLAAEFDDHAIAQFIRESVSS